MPPRAFRLSWPAVLLGAAVPAGLAGAVEGACLLARGGPLVLDLLALRFFLLGPFLAGGAVGLLLWPLLRLLGRPLGSDLAPWRFRAAGGAGLFRAWTGANALGWVGFLAATDLANLGFLAPPGSRKGALTVLAGLVLAGLAGGFLLPVLARTARERPRLRLAGALALLQLAAGLLLPPLLAGPVLHLDRRPAEVAAAHNRFPGLPPLAPQEAPGPPGPRRPDVVVITLDTTRADHLTPYGYSRDTSPRLAEFAREAVRFESAWAASSWTVPTHSTLFTGLFPYSHGARYRTAAEQEEERSSDVTSERFRTWIRPLDPVHTTLAEILRAHGYATGAFVAGPYLLADFGLAQGFDWYDDRMTKSVAPLSALYYWLDRAVDHLLPGWMLEPDLLRFGHGYRRADELTQAVLAWLAGQEGRRLHLFVNYFDAHYPYWPVREVRDLFPGAGDGLDEARVQEAYFQVMRGERPLDPAERAWLESHYDAELRFQDAWLGRLFDELKAEGRWEEALVVVTADHGEHMGEVHADGRAVLQHGFSAFAPVTRVPLLVKFPRSAGIPPGVRRDPVHQADLLPTVLELLGLDPAELGLDLQGRSLLEEGGDRVLLSELYRDQWRVERFGERWSREIVAWVRDGLRLHRIQTVDAAGRPVGEPRLLLYDLRRDPLEEHPLPLEGSRAGELLAELEGWLDRAPRYRPSRWILDWDASGAQGLLDATGYAGGGEE